MQLNRLESAEIIGVIGLIPLLLWDGFGLFSTVWWSCIGRATRRFIHAG